MRTLTPEPIDRDAYAPFGALIAPPHAPARAANHGTAAAWDDLARLSNLRGDGARPTVSLFRCAPHREPTLDVRWLERHPCSTQMFVPMRPGRYLVVVGHGGESPDPASLRAFVVEGSQAITYEPGIWHHPMVALDGPLDFVNFLFVGDDGRDCHEIQLDPPPVRVPLARP